MLSNSCRYGIRAVIYMASKYPDEPVIGIKQISTDLNLPAPFLAKILQQLVKNRLLSSIKGPNGGFSLLKKPDSMSLIDIIKIIDGEDFFRNCVIHDGSCQSVKKNKKPCPFHDDYSKIRKEIITLFKGSTIEEIVRRVNNGSDDIAI